MNQSLHLIAHIGTLILISLLWVFVLFPAEARAQRAADAHP